MKWLNVKEVGKVSIADAVHRVEAGHLESLPRRSGGFYDLVDKRLRPKIVTISCVRLVCGEPYSLRDSEYYCDPILMSPQMIMKCRLHRLVVSVVSSVT
jgi:hypothetical protein